MRPILKSTQFFLLLIVIFICSCSSHSGIFQTTTSLSANNFSYVKKDVVGTASCTYVFGFGGAGKKSLISSAKKDLLEKNPLNNNQALANVTVNEKKSFYLLVYIQRVIITADIVEFK